MDTSRSSQPGNETQTKTTPRVSIIVPAFNSTSSLALTLESVRSQSFAEWEAIVVPDSSSDNTIRVAKSASLLDDRIRVLDEVSDEVSSARNAGIADARGNWLLFLDAGNRILPDHLTNLVDTIEATPGAGAGCSGWCMTTPDGRSIGRGPRPGAGVLLHLVACNAQFAIHACLVQRDLVRQIGGFDPSLRFWADWDFWQRITRLGTMLVDCEGETAIQQLRHQFQPHDLETMLIDGLRLIEAGFSHDDQVGPPTPIDILGFQGSDVHEAQVYLLVWIAGHIVGSRRDAREVLRHIDAGTVQSINASVIAEQIFAAIVLTRHRAPEDSPPDWTTLEPLVVSFLVALEEHFRTPRLAKRAMRHLEHLMLQSVASSEPLTIGGTHATTIEITAPIEDIHVPSTVERIRIAVTLDGTPLGNLEIPVIVNEVSRHLLADAIAERFAWQILDRYFPRAIDPDSEDSHDDEILLETPDDTVDRLGTTLREKVIWTIFLQQLWDRPDWTTDRFYDPGAVDEHARERIDLNDREWIAIEISDELPDIVTHRAAQIVLTAAGIAFGAITLSPTDGIITSQHLRAAISQTGGVELCRICVREAVIGQPFAGPNLRHRLASLARDRQPVRQCDFGTDHLLVAGHVRIDTVFETAGRTPVFVRRQSAPSLTSISWLAPIPACAVDDLRSVAHQLSEVVIGGTGETDGWYLPDIIPIRRSIEGSVWRASSALTKDETAASADPDGGYLPILMYHRVSATGAKHSARYRITPDALEAQLAYLRDAGFQSVDASELTQSLELRQPIPGRRVLLTFDDAYVDFAETAWPLLKRYGFGAILFVVSGCTGGTNEWDHRLGEVLPLLGWDALRSLHADGVTIGAHTVTHPQLTGLSPREVAFEAARSRRIIQQELNAPVHTFAYPYGDRDETVEQIVGSCGYTLGFTCRHRAMHVTDQPLSLPRIEVQGSDTLEIFVRNLSI